MSERRIAQRYVVERVLGVGGMGQVVLARDAALDRPLAIKLMLETDVTQARARFIEEAQITAQLSHPNIVTVHEMGLDVESGQVFLALALIEGEDLKKTFEQYKESQGAEREREQRRLLRLFLKVCGAVEHAHSKGVVHRDLKPANIMIGKNDAVLVLDWGLAKSFSRGEALQVRTIRQSHASEIEAAPARADSSPDSADMTHEGSVVGTPMYMAPEQAEDPLRVDGRADIYALGAILYELVTGFPPYQGDTLQVLSALYRAAPPPPSKRAPERLISNLLEAIILKAMDRDLDSRYQSVQELSRDIAAYLDGAAVSAYREDFFQSLARFARNNRALVLTQLFCALLVAMGLLAGLVAARQERAATVQVSAQTDLASLRARLESWKTKQIAGLAEFTEASRDDMTRAFKVIEDSEQALSLKGMIELFGPVREVLQGRQKKIEERLAEIEAASRSAEGLAGISLDLVRTKEIVDSGHISDVQAGLEKELAGSGDGRSLALALATQHHRDLELRLRAVRRLFDRAYAEALVSRFPNYFVENWGDLKARLELGQSGPLFQARAHLRLRNEAEARRCLGSALEGGAAPRGALGKAMRALALRIQVEPSRALLAVQREAFDQAILESKETSLRRLRNLIESSQHSGGEGDELGLNDNGDDDGLEPVVPSWLFYRRAEVAAEQGDFESGRLDFERAVALNPNDVFIRMAQFRLTVQTPWNGKGVESLFAAFKTLAKTGLDQPLSGVAELPVSSALQGQWECGLEAMELEIFKHLQRGTLAPGQQFPLFYEMLYRDAQSPRLRVLARAAREKDPASFDGLRYEAASWMNEPESSAQWLKNIENSKARWEGAIAAKEGGLAKLREEKPEAIDSIHNLEHELAFYKFLLLGQGREEAEAATRLGREGCLERAQRLAEEGLERSSEDAILHLTLGWSLYEQRQYREALPHLQRGAQVSRDSCDSLLLARCCLALGDEASLELGIAAIRRAMSFDNIAARYTHEMRYRYRRSLPSAHPVYHEVMAELRWKQRKPAEAILHFSRALILAQDYLAAGVEVDSFVRTEMTERVKSLTLRLSEVHRAIGMRAEAEAFLKK